MFWIVLLFFAYFILVPFLSMFSFSDFGAFVISTKSTDIPSSSSSSAFKLRYSLKDNSGSVWMAMSMSLMLSRRVKLPKTQASVTCSSFSKSVLSLAIMLAFCFCPSYSIVFCHRLIAYFSCTLSDIKAKVKHS